MSSEFNPLLWFVCKICREAFPDTDKLKKHQIRKHAEDCKNVKCIVFEERFFDKQWIPTDNYFPESNSEFINENAVEVIPLTPNCGCHCHSGSTVSVEAQTESYAKPSKHTPNPYVLVKRLTFEELNAALRRNIEEPIFLSEKRKRTNQLCVTHDDVQSPNKKKIKHQQNQDHVQNVFCPEIVAPNAKPRRNEFPENPEFSSFSSVSDPFENALSDIKYDPKIQDVEETEFEKQVETATRTSDFQNHQTKKIEIPCHNASTLALPSLSDIGNLRRAQVSQVNSEKENHSETNNPESNPVITDAYYSDSECFETENPVSPELSDDDNILGEQNLPISDMSQIISDHIKSTDIIKSPTGHGLFNFKLNQQEVSVSTSASCSLSTPTSNVDPESVAVHVSEIEKSRRSTRASRKRSKIKYSETHICSNCNLDFYTFNDLRDHQRLCTMQYNRMDFVTNRHDGDSANQRNKNGGDSVVQIDNANDSKHSVSTSPLKINSRQVSPISTRINSSKVRKGASNVTDGGDSEYTADGDEDVSESETNDYIEPKAGPRHRMTKRETLQELSTPTAPQNRIQSKLNAKPKNLALFEWLETQKRLRFPDGSRNKIYLWTKRFVMSKVLGSNNHIKCKLCKIKLETESKLKNHVQNCWLHNQSNHVYCIPCVKPCGSPHSLAKHFQNQTYAAHHANFRRNNGPHVLDSNSDDLNEDQQRPVSTNDTNFHPTDPVSNLQDLPLLQWLKIQRENPGNVVALEPDPFTSNRNIPIATLTVSKSFPIKCKLCLQLLTSDILLRNHVETCWLQNKSKHRYCVPCNKYYKSGFCLRQHQRYKHKNAIYQKQKQVSPCSCTVCHKDLQNESDFNAHQESLQVFLGKSSRTESTDFINQKKPNVDSTQARNSDIPGQEGTMKDLLGWLKHIRETPNSDGTANLVLIDPEPATHSSGEVDKDVNEMQINEKNPITCRLCLKKLTKLDHVQIHVKVCWSQNKERHCYCVSCDTGFAKPTELQEHKASEHSAPKNIVLFSREADSDGSSLSVDGYGLEVNSENPVTCKLCETELTSASEVKIHGENCWFHNKSCHVYCTTCDRRFDTPKKLRCHNTNRHRSSQNYGSVEDMIESEAETETENLLPLERWLNIQKENPNNVIALEPDPLVSETISESSPVKCKLCQQLLTTESALRNHVKICWTQNKAKHCYCIPCNQHFAANQYLLAHNKSKHSKNSAILPTCPKCSIEFLTESELTKHTESLQEFLKQRKNCTKATGSGNSVNTPGGTITMSYLFEWLKHLRQLTNHDGTENIILVDPEPKSDNFDEFNSENPITCRLCQQKFTTVRALKLHVQNCWTQKKEMHRFCVTCEKVFETPQNLQDHSRKEHSEVRGDSFTCKLCSQTFFDVKIFEEHEEAHKDPNFLPFKCLHCSAAFNNKKDMSQHIAALHGRHRKVAAYKCKTCLKSFTAGNLLNNHIRSVHTGERPFKCKFPDCSFAFASTGKRQRHYYSKHREELGLGLEPQQFLCPTCGKTYKCKVTLARHLKISHTQEKPYKCTHQGCAKDFKIKQRLIEHVRGHTGEKPYQCEECGKSFAREWTFIKHKRSHAGTLNRAQCHLCARKFLGGWELKQHLKIHGEGNFFKCQICGFECGTHVYLKKNEETHGNEPNSESDDYIESSADSDI